MDNDKNQSGAMNNPESQEKQTNLHRELEELKARLKEEKRHHLHANDHFVIMAAWLRYYEENIAHTQGPEQLELVKYRARYLVPEILERIEGEFDVFVEKYVNPFSSSS
ncbi:MAG: hypothetical protein MRZ79_04780 [Bacteroidia bacterium]|nr:hypothetical protein [Bacteroidia bacterium]